MPRIQYDDNGIRILPRGRITCPKDRTQLHFQQLGGMRLYQEIVPKKPRRPYNAFDAMCPTCGMSYQVKR